MRLDDDLKYFESEEFKEILDRFEAMEASGTMGYMDADDLADVADYYSLVCHDEEHASEVIDLALRLHPDAIAPYLFKARQCLIAKKYKEAEAIISSISEQDNREVIFLRAEVLICRGETAGALAFINEIDASEDMADRDFFLYDAAYVFIDYDCFDEAATLAARLEEFAPKWFRTWELKADVLLAHDSYADALPYIEQMLDVDAFCTEAWNWRAEAYAGLEDFAEAEESVDNTLAIEPDNLRARQLKAWYLLRSDRYDEAHELYSQLRNDDAETSDHSVYDSFALLAMDRPLQALEAIEEAFGRDAQEPDKSGVDRQVDTYELYQQKALCLGALERPEEALQCLDEGLRVWEGNIPENVNTDALLLRMRIWAQNNNLNRAAKALQQAVECNEDMSVETLYRGAQILYEYGYDDEALDAFTTVLHVTDDDVLKANTHAFIAAALDNRGRCEEALPHLHEAIDGKAEIIQMLFAEKMPAGLRLEEYYDYYYFKVYEKWPKKE